MPRAPPTPRTTPNRRAKDAPPLGANFTTQLLLTGIPKDLNHANRSIHQMNFDYPFLGPMELKLLTPSQVNDLLALEGWETSSTLRLTAFQSQGTIWDAFRAQPLAFNSYGPRGRAMTPSPFGALGSDASANGSYIGTSSTRRPLIVKLTSPDVNQGSPASRLSKLTEEVANEAWIYKNVLKKLQGDVVPQFYGVYASVQECDDRSVRMFAAVMEDAGPAWTFDSNISMRRTVLEKYFKLHEAGVLHGSCKMRHWVKPTLAPISSLKLIDFGRSCVRDDGYKDVPPGVTVLSKDEFTRRAEKERDLVMGLLRFK